MDLLLRSRKKLYNGLSEEEVKLFLEEKYLQYNTPSFILCDPISIPHRFTDQRDREISGFMIASIAWGRRDMILRNGIKLLEIMDNSPYEYVMSASEHEFWRCSGFVHRTFNGSDCVYFLKGLETYLQ